LEPKTLIELAQDRDVRKAAGFRAVAERLDAAVLAGLYAGQRDTAPHRGDAGKKYFGGRDGTLPKRGARRDEDQLAIALVNHARENSQTLKIPPRLHGEEWGELLPLDYHVPLKLAASEPAGVNRVDVLGIGPDDRMAVILLKYVAPSATRGSTGDTPLRALLEALAYAAILDANAETLRAEAQETFGRTFAEAPPLVYLIGSPRYWELCRRREAQKGAAWINQLERLVTVLNEGDPRVIEEGEKPGPAPNALGLGVRFLGLQLDSDPPWELRDEKPTFEAAPRLIPAWESTAGRIKPKSRPRSKPKSEEPEIIEADLSRPMRGYAVTEAYTAGDRIQHPTLGVGVVQGVAGATKIEVLFDGVKRVLVHGRGSPSSPAVV